MKLGERIVDGIFLERPNRYLARVEIDGEEVKAHVPDPGRLPGLMIPGRRVRIVYNPGPKRKTDYSLVLVRHGSLWVSVYPVFANKLVEKGLNEGKLSCLSGYKNFNREVKWGKSRFDFQVNSEEGYRHYFVFASSFFVNNFFFKYLHHSTASFVHRYSGFGLKYLTKVLYFEPLKTQH